MVSTLISNFILILMTKNLLKQREFYKDVLGLDVVFDEQNSTGYGKNGQLYIIIKEDESINSHHTTEHKGPQIITFECFGSTSEYTNKIKNAGFKVRDTLSLPAHNKHYLFVEDYDGNEVCLSFSLRD